MDALLRDEDGEVKVRCRHCANTFYKKSALSSYRCPNCGVVIHTLSTEINLFE